MKSKNIFISQCESTKEKSWLNIQIVSYSVLTGLVYNYKTEGDVYPDLSNIYDSVWW